jgi:hypothetical protein
MKTDARTVFSRRDVRTPTIKDKVSLDDKREEDVEDDIEESGKPHPEVLERNALGKVAVGDPAP